MRTELRFLVAMSLMVGVLVVTNVMFPPLPPEEGAFPTDTVSIGSPPEADSGFEARPGRSEGEVVDLPADSPSLVGAEDAGRTPTDLPLADPAPEMVVWAETPLARYAFSSSGAELRSAELLEYHSVLHAGPVQLVPQDAIGTLTNSIILGSDTLDLGRVPFEVSPAEGVSIQEGGGPQTLTFTYRAPSGRFTFEIAYTFSSDSYLVEVAGSAQGAERAMLATHLGSGLDYNEPRPADEERSFAYVANHLQEGIKATPLRKVDVPVVEQGPFRWVAFKSKYFVSILIPGEDDGLFGGLLVSPEAGEHRASVAATQPLGNDAVFSYNLFMGPQEFARLSSLGGDLEDVNPYGWRIFRPVIRPVSGFIVTLLVFLHDRLSWGYGWVLIAFGVVMRVVLWPLNQKAMKAQLRNMEVQPLLKEIQEKYKDNPERLQKEMMKLYKEKGFNPLAGCLPMLIPWPVLIALFFVFQNTIQLRGEAFLWLPDLSSPDPLYLLPLFLGVSMFLLQWISYRSMTVSNPQMKMMMWMMPIFMVFIFFNLASGLNLYYATANVATLPQQIWIARERQKRGTPGAEEKSS